MDIAIFPLQVIVFPGEQVNLHIFEQRYLDLFNDLRTNASLTFGIPPVINQEVYGVGTQLKLVQIVKDYPNGEMDIIALGLGTFSINNVFTPYLDKTYFGADVTVLESEQGSAYNFIKFEILKGLYDKFQTLLPQQKVINSILPQIYSFQIAHFSALSEEQKLLLLGNPSEEDRQEMLIEHFEKIIPSMESINETQKIILANGHFKNLQSFDFSKLK